MFLFHIRVFEKKLWLQDNRSYTISVSAGPTSFLPDLNTFNRNFWKHVIFFTLFNTKSIKMTFWFLMIWNGRRSEIITPSNKKVLVFYISGFPPFTILCTYCNVHVMKFSSRSYFNQGRPSHHFALKIHSGLFSFSYLNLFSAFHHLLHCHLWLVPAFLIQDEHNISLKLSSSSVPSFREKYSSRENKHFKFLPVN